MPTGTIILFKQDRGYGFIKPETEGDNVYVHISALETSGIDNIEIGQNISYELETTDGKTQAVNIQIL